MTQDTKTMSPLDVQAYQRKAYDILKNSYSGHVGSEITVRHADSHENQALLGAYNKPTRNVGKRTASKFGTLYNKEPRRKGETDEETLFFRDGCEGLTAALREVNNLLTLVCDWFVQAWWNKDISKVCYEQLPPWMVKPEMKRGYPYSIIVTKENGNRIRWFMDGKYQELKGSKYPPSVAGLGGEKVWKQRPILDSGLGMCPIVWFRLNPGNSETWSIGEAADLIDGTIDLGVHQCYHRHNAFARAFKVLSYKEQPQSKSDLNFAVNHKKILPSELVATALADPDDPFLEPMRTMEKDLAASRGISPMSYDFSAENMDQLQAISEEERDRWTDLVNVMRGPETQLLRASMAQSNKKNGTMLLVNGTIVIDYVEPSINLEREKSRLEYIELLIKSGFSTRVLEFMKMNPDYIDEKSVKVMLLEFMEDRAEFIQKARELNIDKDATPGTPGLSPKENGALGKDGPTSLPLGQMTDEEKRAELDGA